MESTGASSGDTWLNATGTYSHSSDDRNRIWSAKLSVSNEFDYFSFGFGGGYTWLFNEKNTELSLHGNIYLDTWYPVYPYELRPGNFSNSSAYNPVFTPFTNDKRNSYSAGFVLSQILSKRLQGSLAADYICRKAYYQHHFSAFILKTLILFMSIISDWPTMWSDYPIRDTKLLLADVCIIISIRFLLHGFSTGIISMNGELNHKQSTSNCR